jgi:capsular polysaccharide transport system permease protein
VKSPLLNALKSLFDRDRLFACAVALPTAVAAIYYGLLASDVYVSESEIVVRTHAEVNQSESTVGTLLRTTGLGRQDDSPALVCDYIQSRDAVHELEAMLNIRGVYSASHISVLNRFPGLSWNASFENFYGYYTRRIAATVDPTSAIVTLTVRAYSAEDARNINESLLQVAERMVNTLNIRSHQDEISNAERDLEAATEKARAAARALDVYRSRNGVYEANKQAELELAGIEKLQDELMANEAYLAQLTDVAPQNPQIATVRKRSDSLRQQIAGQTGRVSGPKVSLASHAAALDRLQVDLGVADKLVGSAIVSLETARSEALNKDIYVERLVKPSLPDYAMEPRRGRSVLTVLLVSLLAWGVLKLIVANIREHAD